MPLVLYVLFSCQTYITVTNDLIDRRAAKAAASFVELSYDRCRRPYHWYAPSLSAGPPRQVRDDAVGQPWPSPTPYAR